MNIIKKRLLLAILAIFVLFGASCSYSFSMKVSGNLDHSILFQFFKEENDEKPSKFDITGFTVYRHTADAQWIVIWDLIGSQTLSSIEYGIKYKGLTEIVPHKPLAKGKQYEAIAEGSVWPRGPTGSAGIVFFFDEGGNLIQGWIK